MVTFISHSSGLLSPVTMSLPNATLARKGANHDEHFYCNTTLVTAGKGHGGKTRLAASSAVATSTELAPTSAVPDTVAALRA
jgi:hypothetical protein